MSVIRKAISLLLIITMTAALPAEVFADPVTSNAGEEAAVSDASAAKLSEAAGEQAAPIDLVPVGMEETGIADEPSAGSSENEEHITDAAEKTDNTEPASLSDTEEGEAFSDPSAEEAGGLAEEEGVSALHGEDAGIPEDSEGDPGESRYLIETDDYAIDEDGTVLIKTNTAVIGEAHRNRVKSVTFAEGVDTLTTWALYHCPNLSYVELPEGFKELNSYSLGWCGLKVVVLPASLETLRAATFDYCSDLTLVIFRGAAPQTYGAAIRNLSPKICYCPSDNWTESARTAIAATGNWVPVTDTFMSFHADRMAAAGRLIETYEAVIANPHNDKEKAGYLIALKNALTSLAETEDRDAIDSVLEAGLAALSEDIFIPYSEGTLYINDVDYSMTEDHSGGNWTYDARLGQLNLTNWSGSYLEATADCNIILSGENTITPAATSRCAVKAGGNLSIDAADDSTIDSLKIIQPEGCSETFIGIDPGWSSGGKLSLMGGTIDIRLRDISGSFDGSYGIYGWNGEITEGSDAVLKVTAEEGSTKVDGLYIVRFKISGGTTIVDVPGTASLDFTMDGGDVTLKGETAIHYRDVDAAFYINSGAGTLTLDGRILSCEGMVPAIAPDHRITEPEGSIFIKADGMLVPADPDTLEEITSMVVSPVIDSGMVITDSPYFDVSATFGESYTGANLRGAVTGCGTHRLDFTLKEGSELPEGLRLTGNQSTGSVYLYGTPTANYKAQDVTFIITDYATKESGELTIRIGEIIDPELPPEEEILTVNDEMYGMNHDHEGPGWSYKADVSTLTLTNWSGHYLEATGNLTIMLSGENTITPAATSRCAVKAGGNLSIDAADDSTIDSLKIIQPEGCSETFIGIDPGWSSGGKLSLMGGTIDIRLRDISGSFDGSYGIYGWNGEITEGSDAVLKVTAEEGSTKVDGLYIVRFKISGGTTIVDVPGTASLDFTMDGGDVTLKGETAIHYRDVDAAFYINSGAGTLTLDGRILSCEGMVPAIAPDHRITEPEGSIFIKADGMLVPADPDTLEEITSMVVSPVIDSGMVITDSPYFDVSATFGESYTGANLRGAVTGCGTHRLDFTLKEGSELPEGLRLTGNQSTGSVYLYGTPTANYKAQDVTFIITDYTTKEAGELTIRIGEIIDPETPIINVTGVSLAGSSIVDEDGVKIICLPSNGRADIAAFVEPAGAQDQNTTLLGGDADIATAWWSDNNGTISWHGEGITTFTVRTEQGNKTDSVKVYAAAYLAYIRTDQAALTNLIPSRCYLIEGVEHRADENGEIPYEAAWSDKTVSIILRSDIDPRCNSTAQNVDIPDLSNVLPADYTAVTEALARVPADLSVYTEETASAVQAAVSAVREGLKIGRQAEVDAMAAAINEAVDSLTIKVVETLRIYGSNRYATSLAIADRIKAAYEVSKFKAVVVATGENYPDALAGGYLAIQKKAPIILIRAKDKDKKAAIAYIKANLEKKGTVYVLGGEPAVPAAWIKDLTAKSSGFTVKRLAGKNRYLTNIAILKEAGVRKGAEILVATGTDFQDALCASALNKPLLIVKTSLSTAQKNYLNTLKGSKFYILGPTSKVSSGVEKALKPYGTVRRVGTSTNVFTRSVQIAREFAPAPNAVALAYSDKYPDGLCGGVLASTAKAPLLLVRDGKTDKAAEYFETYGATEGMTFGSASVISDKTIFSIIKNATHIKEYTR